MECITWHGTCTKYGQTIQEDGEINPEHHRFLLDVEFLKDPGLFGRDVAMKINNVNAM